MQIMWPEERLFGTVKRISVPSLHLKYEEAKIVTYFNQLNATANRNKPDKIGPNINKLTRILINRTLNRIDYVLSWFYYLQNCKIPLKSGYSFNMFPLIILKNSPHIFSQTSPRINDG